MNLNRLKEFLPRSLRQAYGRISWPVAYGCRQLAAASRLSSWAENVKGLRAFHNRHLGKRCFLIGNGPSLRQTDLGLLRNEYTIGLNRGYLLFSMLGFETSYLVAVNPFVLRQFAQEITSLKIPHFVSWRFHSYFHEDTNALFLDSRLTGVEGFSRDITHRVFEGYTVTYVALQLAFFMGFSEVVLVGVDHDFSTGGRPNRVVINDGDDPNHFSPIYFGRGVYWQLPDLANSERAYQMARRVYAESGRSIVDATVGGKLNVFPKVDYASFFSLEAV